MHRYICRYVLEHTDFKACLESRICFVPFVHNSFSNFLLFPVSFHINQCENITLSMQNNCKLQTQSPLCCSSDSNSLKPCNHEGTFLFVNGLQSSRSVQASSVNGNLMANDWSISDQGSLMATYRWLSSTVCWELLGAAACQTHTLSYKFLFDFDSFGDILLILVQ